MGPLLYSARAFTSDHVAGTDADDTTGASAGASDGAGADAGVRASAGAGGNAGAGASAGAAAGAGDSAAGAGDTLDPVVTVLLRVLDSRTGFAPRDHDEYDFAPHPFTMSRDPEVRDTDVAVHVNAAGVPIVAGDMLCASGTQLVVEAVATSDTGHVITVDATAGFPQQLSAGSVVFVRPRNSAVFGEEVTTNGVVALQFTCSRVKASGDAPVDEGDVRTTPWVGFEPFGGPTSPGGCVTSVAMVHRGVVRGRVAGASTPHAQSWSRTAETVGRADATHLSPG